MGNKDEYVCRIGKCEEGNKDDAVLSNMKKDAEMCALVVGVSRRHTG